MKKFGVKKNRNLHQFFNILEGEMGWEIDEEGLDEEEILNAQSFISKVLFNKRIHRGVKDQYRGAEFERCSNNIYFDLWS